VGGTAGQESQALEAFERMARPAPRPMDVLVGYALSIALVCTMTGIILSALLLLGAAIFILFAGMRG
jgi:uncharacterized membrane protein